MKKTILGLGSAAAIIAPIAGVVACGTSEEKAKEKTLKEILTSKVLVLTTEDSVKSNTALLSAIKAQLEKDYGLELKKAHMLTVHGDKNGGTTLGEISATTDANAIKAYVTVQVNDEAAKDDAKNIEIKVRKENDKEFNTRKVETLKEKLEMNYDTTEKPLILALNVVGGIDTADAYTTSEALVSLKVAMKDQVWATPVIDVWITSDVTIEIKKFGDTEATSSTTNNVVDLGNAKKIEIEISSGSSENKVGPTMVSFYAEAVS